jgi:hypothetical protein
MANIMPLVISETFGSLVMELSHVGTMVTAFTSRVAPKNNEASKSISIFFNFGLWVPLLWLETPIGFLTLLMIKAIEFANDCQAQFEPSSLITSALRDFGVTFRRVNLPWESVASTVV